MKNLFMLLSLLICVSGSVAQKPVMPDAPKPNHKIFFAEISALGMSKSADAVTTRRLLDNGGVELNPIFGQHPSPGRQAGINAAFFAVDVSALYVTEHSRKSWLRWTGRTYIALVIANHAHLAACNSRIDPHSSQRCHPILPLLF